jgi:signal transduction histidine kinase
MRQVLLNLLSNALKFTPAGGRVTTGLCLLPTGAVELAVTDTGVGIAPEDIDKLMTPFTQLANVYQRKHHGAGLGLTLVRAFAQRHGGEVAIESELGRGTTVRVRLPASRIAASNMDRGRGRISL